MYIMVKFINCKNVNYKTMDAFKAFFNTIEDYFGDWRDVHTKLNLSRINIKPNYKDPCSCDVALFFESAIVIMTSDVFEYYSKILECQNGYTIEIRTTPIDES